jgi:aspartyl-tRNA synthetase
MELHFTSHWKRTHTCHELNAEHSQQAVTLNGWVSHLRNLGNVLFCVLRDHYGETQIVVDGQAQPEIFQKFQDIRAEYVIAVRGHVRKRPDSMINPQMATGTIEVVAESFNVLNTAAPLPFAVGEKSDASDSLRLKYRYLDLRRPQAKRLISERSRLVRILRGEMDKRRFLDIETPYLYKSTPEGAREFVVPSRLHPGQFYALPQSPQTFKQILMVAGFDRYYQIVKCFRDEDFRADRQPEFTQLDCEMSFVEQSDVIENFSNIMRSAVNQFMGEEVVKDIPIRTYQDVMELYGCDKPDTRYDLLLNNVGTFARESSFKVFHDALDQGGIVNAICVSDKEGTLSRKKLEEIELAAKDHSLKGLAWAKLKEGGEWQSPIAKFVEPALQARINAACQAQEGDLLLFAAGPYGVVKAALSAVRTRLAKEFKLYDEKQKNFLWVVNFPLMECVDGKWRTMHHPFTSPLPEDTHLLDTNPGQIRAQAYDLVCNGWELGGGSIRIHQQALQDRVFRALGLSDDDIQRKFGFLLEALKFGAPPHGGIAFGVDRLAMILTGCDGIRDLIPFPKTQKGTCLMTSSPSAVADQQLHDLHIQLLKKDNP